MATRVIILGSTGSIGRSALDVVRHDPDRFEVAGLAAHSNLTMLLEQAAEFAPRRIALFDADCAGRIDGALPDGTEVLFGPEGVDAVARLDADVALCAMVGACGLQPILSAIATGKRAALANKEPLVMAGGLIMEAAAKANVQVLPVDSEHNAIFQCLEGHRIEDVRLIHLTASGGPFYKRPAGTLGGITPEEATNHPTWDMGPKISVDSATLMNKGLEIIEAMWLFGVPLDKINVIIHPQSIVHSMVEFTDGGILAHLGPTDMKFPIQFALTWPDRVREPMGRLDLATMGALTFGAPDFDEFPCLHLAMEAARAGGTAPAILNAANETAVEAFCNHRLPFLQISKVVEQVMRELTPSHEPTIETILAADAAARRAAGRIITGHGVQV